MKIIKVFPNERIQTKFHTHRLVLIKKSWDDPPVQLWQDSTSRIELIQNLHLQNQKFKTIITIGCWDRRDLGVFGFERVGKRLWRKWKVEEALKPRMPLAVQSLQSDQLHFCFSSDLFFFLSFFSSPARKKEKKRKKQKKKNSVGSLKRTQDNMLHGSRWFLISADYCHYFLLSVGVNEFFWGAKETVPHYFSEWSGHDSWCFSFQIFTSYDANCRVQTQLFVN